MMNIIQGFKNLFGKKESPEDHMKQLEEQNKSAERLAALHTKARKRLKKSKSKKKKYLCL